MTFVLLCCDGDLDRRFPWQNDERRCAIGTHDQNVPISQPTITLIERTPANFALDREVAPERLDVEIASE
jgi:hypothetical protein